MTRYNRIAAEGLQADRAERNAEAALLFRQAASAAIEFGDRAAWFKNMVWAANSTYYKGDAQTSLTLLLEARQSEPEDAPQFEAWLARKLLFHIARTTRPERVWLEQLLTELHSYATTHRVPSGDLPKLEGDLFRDRGDWSTALARYEAAWQAHNGAGNLKSDIALSAGFCCLQLGRFAACGDWIVASTVTGEDGWDGIRFSRIKLALLRALAECQPFDSLLPDLRLSTDRAAGLQNDNALDEVRVLTARVHFLDPHGGDPAADFHPTRTELRRPLKSRQNVHYRYDAHLLYLDYRIACLRHVAGVPAVDDFYYNQPQFVPIHIISSHPEQLKRRLHKARAAVRRTLRYARHLDKLLECDFRQCEVQARNERIEEMARLILTLPGLSGQFV